MSTVEAPPREVFELRESVALREDAARTDGTVLLEIIRPGVGRGKGRHLYEADMLQANAHKFAGWKMYVDHQSEEARRAAGGLPRSIRDLGGRVLESWWDPSVPAEDRFGQGAVVGRVRPTRQVSELVEDDPALVEASINARATSVRPVTRGGEKVWLVEGIEDRGSVDWVTEGGAGGRVASLLEGVYHGDEMEEMALLDSMTDTELLEHLRETRPELVEALAPEKVEETAEVETQVDDKPDEEKVEETEVETKNPVEALREALASEEGQTLLSELVEAHLAEERELIRAEARADSDRQLQLRDMRDQAHGLIDAAKLPPRWTQEAKTSWEVDSPALDIVDEIDDDGNIVKTAEDKLTEAVQTDIAKQRELMADAQPTRVRGQGPALREAAETDDDKPRDSLWRRQLREAGIEDPDEAYAQ